MRAATVSNPRPVRPAAPTYVAPYRTSDDLAFMRIAAYAFAGLMFLRLVLSDPLLNQFYPYSDEGGNVAMKIHPATYGMLGLLFALLTRMRFRLTALDVKLIKPMFAMIGVIVLLVAFTIAIGRSVSIGYLLETYIAGCLIAFMMFLFPPEQRRLIGHTVMTYIVLNATIAIFEKIAGARILPYPYAEISFRPTALTSHPLAIGLINAGTVVFVLATRWPAWVKAAAMLTVVLGTFAAGARTGAIFASLATLMALAITAMPGRSADSRARLKLILFFAVLLVGAAMLAAAGSAGFLERFEGGYIDENAHARIDVYKVFDWVGWNEIFFGSDIVAIKKLVFDRLGILVESSVVVLVFQFGLFGAIAFAGTLVYMMLRLAAGADPRAYIGIATFFATAMSNDALSGKHCYILMMMVLLIAFRTDVADARGRFVARPWGAKA